MTALGQFRVALRRRRANDAGARLTGVGVALLILVTLLAIFAPLVAVVGGGGVDVGPDQPPAPGHLLGTDDVGHDILTQLAFGARVTLGIGLLSALFALSVGLTVAICAGYLRGAVELTLMRLVDLTLSFPFLPLVLVLAAFLGRNMLVSVAVLTAVLWARPARVLRSQVLKVSAYQHVEVARAMGATHFHVMARHLLPRLAPLAIAQFVQAANAAVLLEASLDFLGLGDINHPGWGTMLFFANAHSAFLTDAWLWWLLPPGLALTAAIIGLAFVGFGVEQWSDPRLAGASRTGWRVRRLARVDRRETVAVSTQDEEPILAVRDLTASYPSPRGSMRALDRVSIDVPARRIVGLVGESGSGKTTLLVAILGLTAADIECGAARLTGVDVLRLGPREMTLIRGRKVGYVPQGAMNSLNPAYRVLDQVAESARLTRDRGSARARAAELLDLTGLPMTHHNAYPHELSGGMRQRVAIAIAVANDPSLLLADEPVTGLDVLIQARILRLLVDLRDRLQVSVLIVSHDLSAIAKIADDIVVMHEGRIVETGRSSDVMRSPQAPHTSLLINSRPLLHPPPAPGPVQA